MKEVKIIVHERNEWRKLLNASVPFGTPYLLGTMERHDTGGEIALPTY